MKRDINDLGRCSETLTMDSRETSTPALILEHAVKPQELRVWYWDVVSWFSGWDGASVLS
eukprot:CAMPEP_0201621916 /NCGR_PEP_ID=MMETSP0492-20130828/47134_1 /ASSEMBLY_ACC=CAM_ASM_000837 /TAXON_ID=420259 /ORGANISM="Thalassiosira gravida, Strain GMp14c1" /LENGTH=59 /DNA_ID=CAMNT_0048091485 /DNA_START=1275 /DNA_END=1451 /DNA_ORIENTATION=+